MAFRKMQRSIYDAGRGLSTAVDALEDLGLKFEDLDRLSAERQFKSVEIRDTTANTKYPVASAREAPVRCAGKER